MQNFRKIFVSGIAWKFVFYLSAFVVNILLANRLGARNSGPFFYLLNNISIALLFLNFGVESAITYLYARRESGFSYLLTAGSIWSLLSTLLLALLWYGLSFFQLVPTDALTPLILLYILSLLITAFSSALFYASNNHLIPNLVPSLINLFLIVYLLANPNHSSYTAPAVLIRVYLFTGIITGASFLLLTGRHLRFGHLPKRIFTRKLLDSSLRFFIQNAFVTLLLRVDIWFIEYLCNDADLGNYIQTTKFSQLVFLLPNLASFALFPLFAQNADQQHSMESKAFRLINAYFYAGLAICLLIAICGYWLFPILYGSSFSKMHLIFIALIPGLLFFVASYPLSAYFASINRSRFISFGAAIAVLLMIAADLVLIPALGIYGAAIASSVAYSFYFFWLLIKFKKECISPATQLFSVRDFSKSLRLFIQQKT